MSLFCWLRRFFLFYKKKRFIVLCCKPFLWKTYGMRNTYLLHTLAYINVGFKKCPLAIFFSQKNSRIYFCGRQSCKYGHDQSLLLVIITPFRRFLLRQALTVNISMQYFNSHIKLADFPTAIIQQLKMLIFSIFLQMALNIFSRLCRQSR